MSGRFSMARIMLVDDDRDLADLTKIALVKKGHKVEVFNSSNNIIEEVRKIRPDLILMDIMFPGVGGEDVVKELRKDQSLKNVPVIFLTGLISSEEDDVEKTEITIDGINYKAIGKPYDIDRLLAVVESIEGL
jgi:DNA-binding response OmpR family regulator